jgi:arylsulfatase A-like enzyme
MNVIVVMMDSLRRDYVGAYAGLDLEGGLGPGAIQTPHLDAFAQQSTVFDAAYVNSHPTGPFRRDVWTGKIEFPHRGWGPILRDDVTYARLMGQQGIVTMLIGDTYPLMDATYTIQRAYTVAPPGNSGNYQSWFTGWHLVRGHQSDRWWPSQRVVELPCSPDKIRGGAHRMELYFQENAGRRFERHWSTARVFQTAADWLEENYLREEGFCLWVDSFTPHEPFDPPPWYVEMYDPGYEGESVIFPQYGSTDYLTPAELNHVKALYAGNVSLADRWFGVLMDTVANLGLLQNTVIVVVSDHGHLLGDHGVIGKPGVQSGPEGLLWDGIADIPLIVYCPGTEGGRRSDALVQTVDLHPTLLEATGVPCPEDVQGHSLLPLVRGEYDRVRRLGLYGRHGDTVNVTDGRYTLFLHHPERHPGKSAMYDRQADPRQGRDLLAQQTDLAREFQAYALRELEAMGSGEMALETVRRGLEV